MSSFNSNFREIWLKRKINIVEYEYCHEHWIKNHNKKIISTLLLAILFFGICIWFTYKEIYIGTVVFLALAANFNSKSNHHALATETLNSQYLLSKLVNWQYMNKDKYLDELEKYEDNLN